MYARISLYDGSGAAFAAASPQALADLCKALDTDGISYAVEYGYNSRLTLVHAPLTARDWNAVRRWHMWSYAVSHELVTVPA